MKKSIRTALALFLALTMAVSLAVPAFAVSAVTGVSLDKSSLTLAVSQTATLTATVSPQGADNQSVTWRSNKSNVAAVSDKGVVTAVAPGTADITVTTADGDYTAVCQVTVVNNYVTQVSLTPAGPEVLPVGKTRQLTAQVDYAYDTQESQTVSWSTSNPAVATVNSQGLVTAVAQGSVTILATAQGAGADGAQVSGTYQLTVTPRNTSTAEDVLSLDQTALTCYAGQYLERTLTAPTVTVKNGEDVVTGDYTLTYQWTQGSDTKALGTDDTLNIQPTALGESVYTCAVTAVSKTDSTQILTSSCRYTVITYQSTAIGGVVTLNGGTVSLSQVYDLDGTQTLAQQLLQGNGALGSAVAVPDLSHVVFDLTAVTGETVGTLSAQSGTRYFMDQTEAGATFDSLTFTPLQAGTYTVPFLAYGDKTFYGQLELVVTTQDQEVPDDGTIVCDSAGFGFSGSDFYDRSDADPVVSVVFDQPSAGRLVREFTRGSGAQDEGQRYYTNSAQNGDYHVSTLTYLPPAGYAGEVTLKATMTTQSGQEVERVFHIIVKSKEDSDYFSDVTKDTVGTWAANAVDFASVCGLVTGVETGKFAPNSSMTRGMLVTVLYRAAGQPDVAVTTNFTDLDVGSYYYNAVVWANLMGIVNGRTDTRFAPNDVVTREEIATILYRYASVMESIPEVTGDLSGYIDKDRVDSYAVTPMIWAVSKGIITGTTNTNLSPLSAATRAQVVVMLHRYLTIG